MPSTAHASKQSALSPQLNIPQCFPYDINTRIRRIRAFCSVARPKSLLAFDPFENGEKMSPALNLSAAILIIALIPSGASCATQASQLQQEIPCTQDSSASSLARFTCELAIAKPTSISFRWFVAQPHQSGSSPYFDPRLNIDGGTQYLQRVQWQDNPPATGFSGATPPFLLRAGNHTISFDIEHNERMDPRGVTLRLFEQ